MLQHGELLQTQMQQTNLYAAAIDGAEILRVELVPVVVLPIHHSMVSTASAHDVIVDVWLWVWSPSLFTLISWHLCLEVVETVGLNLHPACRREAW